MFQVLTGSGMKGKLAWYGMVVEWGLVGILDRGPLSLGRGSR